MRTAEPGGARLAERREQAAEAAVGCQRTGEVVVGEQRLLPGDRRQPVRAVDQRVEHGDTGGAARPRGIDRDVGGTRTGRQRQHRQQQAGGGDAGPQAVARHPVHVDEHLVHARLGEREAVRRGAAQRDGEFDGQRSARGERAGQRGERGGGGVDAAVAGQGVAHVAVGAQRLPALQPDLQVVDRALTGVPQGSGHGDGRRAVGGDDTGRQTGQLEPQRPGRGRARERWRPAGPPRCQERRRGP